VKGDTRFNESFAVAVEREGLRRWLSRFGSDDERELHATVHGRREAFVGLVLRYRDKLAAWYDAPAEASMLRAGKAEILAAMMQDYAALKESWGGYSGYDRWFAKGLNNAHFASVVAYSELVPAFEALLEQEEHDMPRFYAAVRDLAGQEQMQRDAILAELGASREKREVATTQVSMPGLR
jgi:predicted aminopeptidase